MFANIWRHVIYPGPHEMARNFGRGTAAN